MKKINLIIVLINLLLFESNGTPIVPVDSVINDKADTLVEKDFINFEATLLSGEKFKLSDHKGKVIMLNFWFINCPPCLGEISDINKVYKTFKDTNVVVLSLANNSIEQLNKFSQGKNSRPTEKIEYPIIPNSQKIATDYGISGYPTTILIDKKGKIRIYCGATVQSLKKYVAFYGDKNLSKAWKTMLKENSTGMGPETSEIISKFINDLLKE